MNASLPCLSEETPTRSPPPSAWRVLAVFLRLGLTSFGGPLAHLGHFRREFVDRQRWLSETAFADLVSLCQFLPGPTSSQVGFAVGLGQAGAMGGLAAFIGFTTPSALLMFAAASGLFVLPDGVGAAFVHGLLLVAVSVVAHAVYGMAKALCRDWFTALLAIATLAALVIVHRAWVQPAAIAAGAFLGAIVTGANPAQLRASPIAPGHRRIATSLFALFLALLAGLPFLATMIASPGVAIADAFYRSGALVFGGGHVVLPLLETETVGRHWLDQPTFLAGYGAAQALPGPLFTFAVFLGAVALTGLPPALGGAIALAAIFLPGLLLVSAALPFWNEIKRHPGAFGLVRGANAAVVGVLAAALYNPVSTSAIIRPLDAAIAAAGFVALQAFRAPSWLVVVVVTAAGAASMIVA